jgi:hypothetical protein
MCVLEMWEGNATRQHLTQKHQNCPVYWQRRAQRFARMRTHKARKRERAIAAGWTLEPHMTRHEKP